MKKLMIAAAAAAMVGGAYANLSDLGIAGTAYNATITLKTTVGKAKMATIQYYLGMDATGTAIWYQDRTIAPVIAADLANKTAGFVHKFDLKKISGKDVPCLTAAGKKDAATLALVKPLATTDKTGKNADGATYGWKSAGKWCDTFSEKGEYCYRTAGTVKTSGILVDNCCAAGIIGAAGTGFVHVFGGESLANSKKVEIYVDDIVGAGAVLFNVDKDGIPSAADVTDNLKNDRTIQVLAIAGQGTYGKVKDNDGAGNLSDVNGILSVSGNAVGTCDSVDCTSCCIPGGIAQNVWDCDTGAVAVVTDTAAYGTFSLKYNAAFTK